MMERVVVMDNGTGFTKMGYAGNLKPAFDIPTLISDMPNNPQSFINSNRKTNAALDFFIG
jgi:actin-related protein 3